MHGPCNMSRRKEAASSFAVLLLMLGVMLQQATARPAIPKADARFLLETTSSQAPQSKLPDLVSSATVNGKNYASPQVVQATSDAAGSFVPQGRRQQPQPQQQQPDPTNAMSAKPAGKSIFDKSATGPGGRQQQVTIPVKQIVTVSNRDNGAGSPMESKKPPPIQLVNKPTNQLMGSLSKDMPLEDDELGMNLPAELSDNSLQVMMASVASAPRPRIVRTSRLTAAAAMPAAGDSSDNVGMLAGDVVVDGY